jgi:hypothetical protein
VPYLLFDNGLFGHKNYLFLFFDQKDKPTKHVASSKQIYTQFSVFVGANIWHNFKSPESRAMCAKTISGVVPFFGTKYDN